MKNALNVIVDIMTLMALCVAAIGHVLPWFDDRWAGQIAGIGEFQVWHSMRSAYALGALAVLICLSLLIRWGPGMRRLLNLAMFVSAFAALLFELLVFSRSTPWDAPVAPGVVFAPGLYRPVIEHRMTERDMDVGYMMSVIPTGIAVFLSLLRMLWTMPPSRAPRPVAPPPAPVVVERKPVIAVPVAEPGFTERRV